MVDTLHSSCQGSKARGHNGVPRKGLGLTFCDFSSSVSISTCCSKAATFSWAVRLRASPSEKNGKVLLCRLGFCMGLEGREDLGVALGDSSSSFPARDEKHRCQDGQKQWNGPSTYSCLTHTKAPSCPFPMDYKGGNTLCFIYESLLGILWERWQRQSLTV